jgi:hypothetical protein
VISCAVTSQLAELDTALSSYALVGIKADPVHVIVDKDRAMVFEPGSRPVLRSVRLESTESIDSFHSTSAQLAEKLYTSARRAPNSRLKQSRFCDREACHSSVRLFGCGFAALGSVAEYLVNGPTNSQGRFAPADLEKDADREAYEFD